MTTLFVISEQSEESTAFIEFLIQGIDKEREFQNSRKLTFPCHPPEGFSPKDFLF